MQKDLPTLKNGARIFIVFKLQQMLDEKNNIHSVSFIMAVETNIHDNHMSSKKFMNLF